MVTVEDAKQMTVNDLKKELKQRDAATDGKKAELLERLVELIKEEEEKKSKELPETSNEEEKNDKVENEDGNHEELPSIRIESSTESSSKLDSENMEIAKAETENTKTEELNHTTEIIPTQNQEITSEEKPTESKDQLSISTEEQTTSSTQPTPQPSLSLNEKIKQNLKKRKEQENTEVSNSLPSQTSIPTTSKSTITEEKTTHIRIDNFQRPLNMKNFIKWFSDIVQIPITEDKIWFNFIKTHCYIDFQSIEDAESCISKVTGLKYPNTSTAILSAHFTKVTVAEAPTSMEASLKPGEWLKYQKVEKVSNNSNNNNEDDVSLLGKRKSEDVKLAGANLFKRAAVTAFQTNTTSSTPKSTNTPSRLVQPSGSSFIASEDAVVKREESKQKNSYQKSLDERFRKTKTLPSIYWLPVEESVAERRRNLHNRLGKK